jgi:tRNA(fMet)-specific endonuclease VapC
LTLLDTNTIVHYIKGNPGVVSRLREISVQDVAVPSIVVYELERGTLQSKGRRRRELGEAVLRDMQVIPFDEGAAIEAAKIQVELESRGTSIGPMNLLIAAIARHHSAVLVTNNVKEFSRVRGLKLSDWRTV